MQTKTVAASPSIELAPALAREGFYVFPVNGKKPAIKGWQSAATRDDETIRSLWAGHDEWGVGILTERFGDDEALVAVDVDVKDGVDGNSTLLSLELQGYELPPTRRHNTRSGGHHLLYRAPKPVKQGVSVLGPGIDIRSKGGYVVAYPGDAAPFAQAPQWLLDRCGKPNKPAEIEPVEAVTLDTPRAIARAAAYLANEAPTEGDPDAYKVACRVKDLGVSEATALRLMQDIWDPRCGHRTDDTIEPVRNAYRYGNMPAGISDPAADFEPLPEAAPRKARYRLFGFGELQNLPPARWLVNRWLPENGLGMVFGPPKAGKTFWALGLSLSVATGRPFHGEAVTKGRVIYCAGENAPARIGERAAAWAKDQNVSEADCADWKLLPARVPLNDPKSLAEFQALVEGPCALIVFDTLNRSMVGNENSQEDMTAVVAGCDAVREMTGATILLVHHTGKDETRGARGSSVMRGAIDTGITLKMDAGTGVITAAVEDQRDGESPPPMHFEQQPVLLDDTGRSAPVLVRTRWTPGPEKLGKYAVSALAVLEALAAEEGSPAPTALDLAPGIKVVRKDRWKEKWVQNPDAPPNPETRRSAFKRAVKELLKVHIEEFGDFVWFQEIRL